MASCSKKIIIAGVAAGCLVVLALGLGLGLGLRPKSPPVKADPWLCSAQRCGETRNNDSSCSCSHDCQDSQDCCTNYRHICHAENQWVDDQCEDLSTEACPAGFPRQPLLLVSLDGLRPDYLTLPNSQVPVLRKLKKCGTSTPFIQAAFPSKTFPNHYTIVTGLYPESNGLVDNSMFDPELNASFSLSNDEKTNPAWYQGQPIWHTASYQGLKSGTFFWPGSDVQVNGSYPNIYKPYDGDVPFEKRVFTVLQWLQLPQAERPDFFTLYLEEPDKAGHNYGPNSDGLKMALERVDRIMGQLMNGLKQLNLHRCLNLIILADHGMEEISCKRKEVLQDFVGNVSSYWVYEGPFSRIRARNSSMQLDSAALVANLTCRKTDQKITPYLKAHLPKRLHFANNRRIEDVNIMVQPKWLFERYPGSLSFCNGGNHGYDNDAESMHAMFLSYGPKFLQQTEVEPFSNIELYNLMCDLLGVTPTDNNGTHGSLNHLLATPFFIPSFPNEESAPTHCQMTSLQPEDQLGCSCSAPIGNDINSRLNLTAEQVEAVEQKHIPLGRPKMLQVNQSYCVLHQEAFVSGYSQQARMALWTSFTMDTPVDPVPLPPVTPDCVRPDVRVPPPYSQRCDQYHANSTLTPAFLYPPNLNSTAEQQFDALLTSNLVPMFPAFKSIWDYFQATLLQRFASVYNGMTVVMGPAFDYNYDGRHDTPEQIQQFLTGNQVPVPTHYFAVLTSCRNSSQSVLSCNGELQSVSFLLPHQANNSEICRSDEAESSSVEDFIWFHQARVRDVEWLTGLDFYQDSNRPLADLLRMKARPTAAIERK